MKINNYIGGIVIIIIMTILSSLLGGVGFLLAICMVGATVNWMDGL